MAIIFYWLLIILLSLVEISWSQTSITRDVVPDTYWVFQSNQYDSNLPHLQDHLCKPSGNNSMDQALILLQCEGPSSTLFDGAIGREIPHRPEGIDLLQHYTWEQQIIPKPYVAMSFNPPLVELPNITMYFYRRILDIRVPLITMCFSRSLNFTPCHNIELPERPRVSKGVVVWPITLLTNVTSVTYLRIDMQYDDDDDDDFIFLSEIRIAERLQDLSITQSYIPSPTLTSISSQTIMSQTPAVGGEDNNPISINTITPRVVNTATYDDDDSVSVAVISGTIVGISLLTIVIIIMMAIIMILCKRRNESRRTYSIDVKDVTIQLPSIPQQKSHTSNCDTSGEKANPWDRQETINYLYMPNKVDPLQQHLNDTSRSGVTGRDVIITPNPSYSVNPYSSQSIKKSDSKHQYDYVQCNDGKVVGPTTSERVCNDPADNVNINPNPSYSLPQGDQEVKLQDNPSYIKLKL